MFFSYKIPKNKYGFTIIELIVSASIIAIISTMVVANFHGSSQRFALDNEAERLSSVIRQAHINSLIGLTVNGIRPSGGFGVHISECGLQQDSCLEWVSECQGWEDVCHGWEDVCQGWEDVCSSGDVRNLGPVQCYTQCGGNWDLENRCCCYGTWSEECTGGYESECTGGHQSECTGGYQSECTGGWQDVCSLYGEEDLGDCHYLLFADNGDYVYNEADDTLMQNLGLLDDNIYVDAIVPTTTDVDIIFTPPHGTIYINGSATEDDVTIRLGFERQQYKNDIIIDRNTGRIDIQ